ncbi:UNVERIFIED_CONTAM: putative zinc metalloprotease EGY2, chloroplastic [Sesamum calycinum]|uniref:Zinc metalloprotease EGY2, chloroplastic n=1 Tax=Sesamum calycinum TaxID=2727403 RepID=A0AAW2LU82_9LAMI
MSYEETYGVCENGRFNRSDYVVRGNVRVICRVSETETEPERKKIKWRNDGLVSSDSISWNNSEQVSENVDVNDVQVATGSPLPGVKQQEFDESFRIPKETIEILKDQVFGFDTFFVTSQEPYEDRFGDLYKLFLLINPEDEKPVAVVVPRKTLQPDATAVPEWFAAGAFGLVTVFTLLLRNVPALQSNLLSVFDNVDLLKDGLPGALVTALILAVHEVGHIVVAKEAGIKLGVPYFVPSWQIGSFGSITRILNIVPKREDLLKVAAAGPLAGFALGFLLLLLGFVLPPADELGIVVDPSVFHESLLVGGIGRDPLSLNPLVIWAWAGLLINAINSIPAGELDGGRISFAIWGRKASSRFTAASIVLLGLASLLNDVAFYWVVLIFFLQRGPIAPLSEEITDPDNKYKAIGVLVLLLGLLVCLPYPFPFTSDVMNSF